MNIELNAVIIEERNTVDCSTDEETLEDDVNYGIADCRRRLRSQRSSLRAQHHPPKDGSNGDMSPAVGRVKAVIT
ncbi:MAG TPA: hypothetical protein VFR78_04385 [Pyrinomonadaceae bacterium]|nr:hypothetical protein [Pyrinomonadaceae bacterium]